MNPIPKHLLTLGFLLFGGAVCPAQTAAPATPVTETPPIELSVFEVTTTRDTGYQATNAAEATRMDTPLVDIPMNVTVFNQQFIDDLLAVETTDVLAYDSSLIKTSENDGFVARGFSSVGSNFLNGFAQTAGFGSQPLANIERVEVIKGPAAVLYGEGGFGATINRITKQPLPTRKSTFRAIARNHDSLRLEFDNTGPLPFGKKNQFLYRVNGIWEDGETYIGTFRKEKTIAPSFAWYLTPRTKLVVEYMFNRHDRQGTWDTPIRGGNYEGIQTGNGQFLTFGDRDFNYVNEEDLRRNDRQVISTDLRHAFTPNLQFRSQVQFESREQTQVETQPQPIAMTILNDAVLIPRIWRSVPRDTKNYRTRNEMIWKVQTGPIQHRLLGGFGRVEVYDISQSFLSPTNYGGLAAGSAALEGNGRTATTGPAFNYYPNLTLAQVIANPKLAGFNPNLLLPLNLFDRNNEPAIPPVGARTPLYPNADTKTVTKNTDFYANNLMSFFNERLFVSAGVRFAQYDRVTQNFLRGTFPNRIAVPNPVPTVQEAEATTSSFGLVYHLTAAKTLSLYANMNSSFLPEYRSQADGTPLDPVEGNQKEVGLKFSYLGGRLQGLVTYFDILQQNVVVPDPLNPGSFLQIDGQTSKGFEFNLNARVTENWMVFGGLTTTDSRETASGTRFYWQPRSAVSLFNRYAFTQGTLKGFSVSVGTIYNGERPVRLTANPRNEPVWTMPEYWKVDLILGYKFPRHKTRPATSVVFKVKNVLNETDIFYFGQDYGYSADFGREWEVGATFNF